MSRISSSVGLITGIPIEDTVKKLMEVAAKPRDDLKARNDALKQQQSALDTLSAKILGFQFAVNKLKASSVFETRDVKSSNPDALSATLPTGGKATVGAYQVRPVRAASAQQLVSQRFESADEVFEGGVLSFGVGGFLDSGVSLDQLNGGAGVPRGKIRVTDRSGASTTIDLSFARTVDDVIAAFNSNTDIAVTAATSGDAFTLTDASGGTGNLRVQELGGGKTAAGLGLAGVNAASSAVTGDDVLRLSANTKLATLNDGNGVAVSHEGIADIEVGLSDGSSLAIDLADARTLGDVIEQINAADDSKLTASISADGERLELHDLTGGGGGFTVANGVASTAAEDLGLVSTGGGATLVGTRLIGGLRDTLLSSLNGGHGPGTLGAITITDRNGATDNVDLSTTETVGEVIDLINASSAEVEASINTARNGIVITDASGGTGHLTIASADAADTAEALGIAIEDDVEAVNSGALKRQTVSEATLLSSLNGGKGVKLGDLRITDSDGVTQAVDLNSASNTAETVGDVIHAINALTNGVEARINDSGDGILLVDTAQGDHVLGVADVGGDVGASLRLTGPSSTVDVDGTPTQVIDGTGRSSVDLDDLRTANAGVALSSLNNGAGVVLGDIRITDSQGRSIALDLNGADAGVTTVSQLIQLINDKAAAAVGGFGVTARLDDSRSGIYLDDSSHGSEKLTVVDVNGTTAAGLKLTGEPKTVDKKQVIDGLGAFDANASRGTALEALADRINDLGAGVTASTIFDGLGYRLSLTVNATGDANQLLVDAGAAGFQFEEVSKAQDALLLYGNFNSPGAGVLLNSPYGQFSGAVGGADVTVNGASDTPVTVTISQADTTLVDTVQDMVNAYNSMRTDLGKLTSFDPNALTTGLLFGTNEALQVDSRLSRVLTDRYFGFGDLQTLTQIGLNVAEDGTLELDKDKLRSAFEENPAGIEDFLSKGETGVAAKIGAAIDRLAGAKDSLFANRGEALSDTIQANDDRLAKFDEQLDRQQERMLLQFYNLESVIAKLQNSLSAIQNLQAVPPLGGTSSSKK